jgi:hypothetical protein
MSNPITVNADGQNEWTHEEGMKYAATGVDRSGKRFKIVSKSWLYISQINIWRGNKWLLHNGRKYKIQSVVN